MASPRGSQRIPQPWDHFFIGRKLREKLAGGRVRQGLVKHYWSLKLGHDDPQLREELGVAMEGEFKVEWEDGQQQQMREPQVAQMATQWFEDAEWVHPVVRYLQKHNWEGHRLGIKELEQLAEQEAKAAAKAAAKQAKPQAKRAAATPATEPAAKKPRAVPKAKAAPASGGRKKAAVLPTGNKMPNLEEALAAKYAKAGGTTPSKSLSKPAAAAARLAPSPAAGLDQGASNSLGAGAAVARSSQRTLTVTSPRSGAATAAAPPPLSTEVRADSSSGVVPAAAAARLSRGANPPRQRVQKAPQPKSGAGAATAGPGSKRGQQRGGRTADAARVQLPGPGASMASPAVAAAACRPDEVGVGAEDLTADRNYTFLKAHGKRFYKYNLRQGPDGQLYRIYSKDLMVRDAECYNASRDRLCRDWKLKTHDDTDYSVERVVAERYHPQHKTMQYLVKWMEYELDLDNDNWLVDAEMASARDALSDWFTLGRPALQQAVEFFVPA